MMVNMPEWNIQEACLQGLDTHQSTHMSQSFEHHFAVILMMWGELFHYYIPILFSGWEVAYYSKICVFMCRPVEQNVLPVCFAAHLLKRFGFPDKAFSNVE